MWRCPHCGTPQAETARCWVCRRSSTACGTCRNFRRSVAGSLGYCGLDRRRQPLVGDEIRACWEARPGAVELGVIAAPVITPLADDAHAAARVAHLEFVDVDAGATLGSAVVDTEPPVVAGDTTTMGPGTIPPPILPGGDAGWSLWGDPDR